MRAVDRRFGLGGGTRPRRDERPRRRGPGRHDCRSGGHRPARRGRGRLRRDQRRRRVARWRPGRAAAPARRAGQRRLRGGPRLSRKRSLHGHARAHRPDRDGGDRGRTRAPAGDAPGHELPRARPQGQLGRARRERARRGGDDGVRRPDGLGRRVRRSVGPRQGGDRSERAARFRQGPARSAASGGCFAAARSGRARPAVA